MASATRLPRESRRRVGVSFSLPSFGSPLGELDLSRRMPTDLCLPICKYLYGGRCARVCLPLMLAGTFRSVYFTSRFATMSLRRITYVRDPRSVVRRNKREREQDYERFDLFSETVPSSNIFKSTNKYCIYALLAILRG